MKIQCGKDTIDITKVTDIYVCRKKEDLEDFEKKLNGDYPRFPCASKGTDSNIATGSHSDLRELIENTLNERRHIFMSELKMLKPYLEKHRRFDRDRVYFDQMVFSLSSFDESGNAYVKCKFSVAWDENTNKRSNIKSFSDDHHKYEELLILTQDIIPIFKKIAHLENPHKKHGVFQEVISALCEVTAKFSTYPSSSPSEPKPQKSKNTTAVVFGSNSHLQICNAYNEYQTVFPQTAASILGRIAQREKFLKEHADEYILVIKTARSKKMYMESFCDFDIWDKEAELQTAFHYHQRKLENSTNPGEQAVEYAIKWYLASGINNIVSIKGDCESRHRYNCIQLTNPSFIDEPQEYDHILVCPAGIVLIETKHWKGAVEIREDGKWLRKEDVDTPARGVDSPKFQMRRHEMLMQSILPGVNIHSVLCFSNPCTVIDGRENFKDYPIIVVDQLEETLSALCANATYSQEEVEQMVATIESYKLLKCDKE